jgi:predicted alpha/beta hydrolase
MIDLRASTLDGVELSVRGFPANGEPQAVLLCGHAMMANARYLHRPENGFASAMAAMGVSTYVFDFRAHGQSVPPAPGRSSKHCFDDYVHLDLPAVCARVAAHAGVAETQLCYLGHSLGGVAALAAIGTGAMPTPRRLSLWAVSLWLEGPGGRWKRRALMASYQLAAQLLGKAPIRRLGLGTDDESLGYVKQLNRWAQTGAWTSEQGHDYEADLASIDVPTLGVLGAGDTLCAPADANRFLEVLPGALPLRLVGRAQGDALDPDHFTLFTDARMQPVWRELVDFLIE